MSPLLLLLACRPEVSPPPTEPSDPAPTAATADTATPPTSETTPPPEGAQDGQLAHIEKSPCTEDTRIPDTPIEPLLLDPLPDDADGDGSPSSEDCDDQDANVFPGAAERCDGKDTDCDPSTSEDGLIRTGGQTFHSLEEAEDQLVDPVFLCGEHTSSGVHLSQMRMIGFDATLTADRVSLGTGGAIEGVEIVAPRDARLPPVRVSGCSNRLERVTVRGSPAGGIRVTEGSLELVDSLVTDNDAEHGAGIHVTDGTLRLERSEITGNRATGDGGGVRLERGRMVADAYSVIADNTADRGGGVALFGAPSVVSGGVIRDNQATQGGGLFAGRLEGTNPPPQAAWAERVLLENNAAGSGSAWFGRVHLSDSNVWGHRSAADGVATVPADGRRGDDLLLRSVDVGEADRANDPPQLTVGEATFPLEGIVDLGCDGDASTCRVPDLPDSEVFQTTPWWSRLSEVGERATTSWQQAHPPWRSTMALRDGPPWRSRSPRRPSSPWTATS
mgnify:CR=1 FL=1